VCAARREPPARRAGGDGGRAHGHLRAQLQPAGRGGQTCAGRPGGRCTSRCWSTTRCAAST
jgi:hypothetical protein